MKITVKKSWRAGVFAMLCSIISLSVYADSVDQYLEDAKNFQQKGQYRSAIIQLKNALQKNANQPQIRLQLAQNYLKIGDGASAEKELKRAKELGAEPSQVLPLLGEAYFQQRKFKEMLAELNAGKEASPKLQATLLGLQGTAHLGLGDNAKAQEKFNAALKLDANSEEAWLGQTRAALLQKDSNAATQVDELVKRFPQSADAWILKGELHRLRSEFPSGAEAFQKALALEPENVNALLGEAIMLIAQKKYEEGGKHVETVLRLVPRHPVANYLKGLAAFQQSKFAPAEEALQQTLAVAPNYVPAHLLLGAIQYSKGNLEEAADSLKRFLAASPEHLPARKLYAATQLRLKQPDRAIETIDVALKQNSNDPQLLSLLGSAYMQKGDSAKGIDYLEKAVAAAPNAAALHTQLALGYIAAGESEQAVSQLESAVDLGGVSQADILLVLTHLQRNEFDKALKSAQALAKKLPNNPVPVNFAGAAYLGKKDIANARKQFELALKYDPAFAPAHTNLARLDEAAGDAAAAKRHYQAILDKNDKDVGAMLAMARLADRAGNQEEALRWLQQARTKVPEALEPAVLLARYYLSHGEAPKALSVTQDISGRYPDHPLALEIVGEAQLANNQISNAVATFRKLVAGQPKSAQAYYLLTTAQVQNKDIKGAEASVSKALELQSDFPAGLVMLAIIKEQQGQQQEAVNVAHRLQKKYPDAAAGYEVEGDIYLKGGKVAEAAKAYENAYPRGASAALAVKLYQVRHGLGQANATEALEQWLKAHPEDMAVTMTLASAYQAEKRNKDAIVQYERALKKQPQNVVILNNLAWLYDDKGDSRSLEYAQKAYDLKSDSPAIADTLGWILLRHGETRRALELLQDAVTHAPDVAEMRYHLAAALHKAGRKEEARVELERLLNEKQDFTGIESAKSLLREIKNQ